VGVLFFAQSDLILGKHHNHVGAEQNVKAG